MLDGIYKSHIAKPKHRWILFIFLLCASTQTLGLTSPSQANTISWPQEQVVNVPENSEYFIDRKGGVTIDDVRKSTFNNRFTSYERDNFKLGRTQNPVWLKFAVANSLNHTDRYTLSFDSIIFDEITLYTQEEGGNFSHTSLGDHQRKGNNANPRSIILKEFTIQANNRNTHFIRLKNVGTMRMGIQLSTAKAISKNIEKNNLLKGLYYGSFVTVLILFSFLFTSNYRKQKILYISSSLSLLLAFAFYDGLLQQALQPVLSTEYLTIDAFIYCYYGLTCWFVIDLINIKNIAARERRFKVLHFNVIVALSMAAYSLIGELAFNNEDQNRDLVFILLLASSAINFLLNLNTKYKIPLNAVFNTIVANLLLLALVILDHIQFSYTSELWNFRLMELFQLIITAYIMLKVQQQYNSRQLNVSNSHDQHRDSHQHQELEKIIAAISTDMRTPLSGVTGMVDLLKTTKLNERQSHCLSIIEQSSDSIIKIVNEALDNNSSNSEAIELKPKIFNLEDCIINASHPLVISAVTNKIELLHIRDVDMPCNFFGDERKIQKILGELIGIAIDRSRNSVITIKSQVKNSPDKEKISVVLEVIYRQRASENAWRSPLSSLVEQEEQQNPLDHLNISQATVALLGTKLETQRSDGSITLRLELSLAPGPYKSTTANNALTDYRCLLIGPKQGLFEQLFLHLGAWKMQFEHVNSMEDIDKDMLVKKQFDCAIIDLDVAIISSAMSPHFIREYQDLLPPSVLLSMSPRQHPALNHDYKWISRSHSKPVHLQELQSQLKKLVKHERHDSGDYISLNSSPQLRGSNKHIPIPGIESIRVLVAEDNVVNRQVVKSLLHRLGAQAAFAVNGTEAMIRLSEVERNYDIVFMDVDMPEMDGYEATEKTRQFEKRNQLKTLPIIAITAHSGDEFRDKAFASGMSGFINKPITLESLRNEIVKVIDSPESSNVVSIKASE